MLAIGADYWDYTNPDRGSGSYALHHLGAYLHYELRFFGASLDAPGSPTPAGAGLVGAALLAVFVGVNLVVWTQDRRAWRRLVPWTALGAYSIGAGVLTGIARLKLRSGAGAVEPVHDGVVAAGRGDGGVCRGRTGGAGR